MTKLSAYEQREKELQEKKQKDAEYRKKREQIKQQEIEMHIKLQKDEDMKKRTMTMQKLSRAEEMVQSSMSKKQQEMEKKIRMDK